MENKELKSTYYEFFTESFVDSNSDGIGDLRGLRSKFSIIAQLGINYCLINNVYEENDGKYNFYKVDKKFGHEDSMAELCQKAKEFRMKIILDFDSKDLLASIEKDSFLEEFIKIIEFWKEAGIRGIRLNDIDYLFDTFGEEAKEILEKIYEYAKGEDLLFVGEITDENILNQVKSLDMVYLSKANSLIEEKNSFRGFYEYLDKIQDLRGEEGPFYGLDFENLAYPRLLDKLIEIGEDPTPLAEALASLHLTMNTIPFLYQGVEIESRIDYELDVESVNDENIQKTYKDLLADGNDPSQAEDIIRKTSNLSAKLPIRWDDSALGGFSEVKNYYGPMVNLDNNFKKYLKDKDSFFFFLHELIMMRKRISAFGLGDYEKIFLDDAIYAYKRTYKDDTYVVLVNLTDDFYELDENISQMIDGAEVISNNNLDFEIELLDAYQALILKI